MIKKLTSQTKNLFAKEPSMEETHDDTSHIRKILRSVGPGKGLKKRTIWLASAAAAILLAGPWSSTRRREDHRSATRPRK
jgi:hypothetical protein